MIHEHLIWDTEGNRSRIRHAATRRRGITVAPRDRLGRALVRLGTRLQTTAPPLPEPAA